MQTFKPSYYNSFTCLAAACPDSCCKEWDVDVDDASAARYRALPGALGEKLRRVLIDTEDGVQMAAENGRCPMWRRDGLCQIQLEMGEGALCQVCRAFPRLRHDYGDFVELGLELSCPEAARLILCAPLDAPEETHRTDDPDMVTLLRSRSVARQLIRDYPPRQALTALLFLGAQTQQQLDGGEAFPFSPQDAIANSQLLRQKPLESEFFQFFQNLEILTPQWAAMLCAPVHRAFPPETAQLARYLIDRYWLQAISDFDIMSRAKWIVVGCILVSRLQGDYVNCAQLFSKEIENDADNLDAILDAAETTPAFTAGRLIGMMEE